MLDKIIFENYFHKKFNDFTPFILKAEKCFKKCKVKKYMYRPEFLSYDGDSNICLKLNPNLLIGFTVFEVGQLHML